MNIKTKYEIGEVIWIVYEHNGEVHAYDDTIVNIVITEEKELKYCSKASYEELYEEDIILYDEDEKLIQKIKETMKQIREKEAKED